MYFLVRAVVLLTVYSVGKSLCKFSTKICGIVLYEFLIRTL